MQPMFLALLLPTCDSAASGTVSPAAVARLQAIRALQEKPAKPHKELAKLLKDLEDKDEKVRASAADTLAEMKDRAKEITPALLAVRRDKDDHVRRRVFSALSRLSGDPDKLVPVFLEGLKDPDPGTPSVGSVSGCSVEGLMRLGSKAKAALPTLLARAEDKKLSPRERFQTWGALCLIAPGDADIIAFVAQHLDEKFDAEHRLGAVVALTRIGPEAKDAIPKIAALLDLPTAKETRLLKNAAMIALSKMEKLPEPVVVKIGETLVGNDDGSLRAGCLTALTTIGPKHPKVVLPYLKKLLVEESYAGVEKPLAALKEAAVPDLISVVENKKLHAQARILAMLALQGVGSAAQKAIPALKSAAGEGDMRVSRQALRTLKIIQP